MMRLARALAAAGVCSRREAEDRIRAGRVTVNGAVVTEVATNVDALHDRIEHDGTRVFLERPMTVLLYKPEGVLCTVKDTHGRETVRDLLPNVRERVYPVGRLDADASGVLLLTNDGDLAYRLTHPRYEVKKVYRVWVEGMPSEQRLRQLARGVVLSKGERPTAPARVSVVRGLKGGCVLRITLHEGRKHEIKRMCERIGHPCTRLVREKFAGLGLSGLSPGHHRELNFKEVRRLRKLTGLDVDREEVLKELEQRLGGEAGAAEAEAPRPPRTAEAEAPRPPRTAETERTAQRRPRPTGKATRKPEARPHAGRKRTPERRERDQFGPEAPPKRPAPAPTTEDEDATPPLRRAKRRKGKEETGP